MFWKPTKGSGGSSDPGAERTAEAALETAPARSPRSQRSLLQEQSLRGRLEKFVTAKRNAESRIREAEAEQERYAKRLVIEDRPDLRTYFNDAIVEQSNSRALLASCERRCAELQAAIDSLIPSPEQSLARSARQEQFERLATQRLAKDRAVYELIGQLGELCKERNGLTAEMRKIAGALDLAAGSIELDVFRFEKLAVSLPPDEFSECEHWHSRFLGKQCGTLYVVRDESLVVGETLVHPGFYSLGERIYLREEEARELLRDDRPAPAPGAPWRCKPPSVMTVEAYDALIAKQKPGTPAWLLLVQLNSGLEEKAKGRYLANRHLTPRSRAELDLPELPEELDPGTTVPLSDIARQDRLEKKKAAGL